LTNPLVPLSIPEPPNAIVLKLNKINYMYLISWKHKQYQL
jgi:hypothetical protein